MNDGRTLPDGSRLRRSGGATLVPGAARPSARAGGDVDRPAAPGSVFRVVIVDDTPDLRDLLTVVLHRASDFQVVGQAGDGREGLRLVREERPDVVLLDLAMPVMSGLEALPRTRRLVPDAAIVVLSGFGAEAMAQRALDAGADSYVEKGTPAPRMLDRIREVLGAPAPTAGPHHKKDSRPCWAPPGPA